MSENMASVCLNMENQCQNIHLPRRSSSCIISNKSPGQQIHHQPSAAEDKVRPHRRRRSMKRKSSFDTDTNTDDGEEENRAQNHQDHLILHHQPSTATGRQKREQTTYSEKFKREVLKRIIIHRESRTKVCQDTNLAESTLRGWLNSTLADEIHLLADIAFEMSAFAYLRRQATAVEVPKVVNEPNNNNVLEVAASVTAPSSDYTDDSDLPEDRSRLRFYWLLKCSELKYKEDVLGCPAGLK